MRLRSLVFVAASLAACAPELPAAYLCTASPQCVFDGVAGVCEANGVCSFPDVSCASGRRYGSLGPAPLAGTCVGAAPDGGSAAPDGGSAGMISRVGVSSRAPAAPSGTSATVNVPNGAVAGDLLLATVFADANAATITAPSGWTQHASLDGGVAGSFRASWFFKVVAAGDAPQIVFTVANANNVAIGLVAYRGVSMSMPIDAAVNQSFEATALTAPSITTTHANDMLVAMFVDGTPGLPSLGPPSGMQTAVATDGVGVFDALQASAGPTGTKTASLGVTSVPGLGGVDFVALAPAP